MLKSVFGVFILVAIGAWGQTPNIAANVTDKVDRAAAYYYYATAHMYALKATNRDGTPNTEYVNKAIENYRAAIKADPQASPRVSEELSEMLEKGRLRPVLPGLH